MVNKQVMGGREGREGLGQGRTKSRPPQDRILEGSVQEGRTGDCLQGALWSHAAYGKYLHAFTTLGLGALSCQVGTWGTRGPSALRRRLWAQSQRL